MISPAEAIALHFSHRALDGRTVRLGYALLGRSGIRVDLEETLDLPDSLGPLASPDDPAVARALLGLHLAAGTSYWKTCIPRDLVLQGAALSDEDAAFWTDVYTRGMGEFFFKNGIDPEGRVRFPGGAPGEAVRAPAAKRPPLLLWGGGKDSVVSHEVLAAAGEAHDLLTIGRGRWTWVSRSASVTGAPHHLLERRLDPRLFEMNAAGALNGHVPVNAYLAFAGLLVAVLTARPAVIASNESSASEGNALWHGMDVNHQWSKSLAFERMARAWVRRNLEGAPDYLSLLRPLSELRIVKAFAAHPAYFEAVTSCNANFRQADDAPRRWCLKCPKCVFVAMMARPWLDDAAYHALLEGDALADPANVTVVEELLGVRGVKPFECVGTPEETAVALHLAKANARHVPHGVMTVYSDRVAPRRADPDALAARVIARGDDHELSPSRLAQLDDYLHRH